MNFADSLVHSESIFLTFCTDIHLAMGRLLLKFREVLQGI